MQKPQDHNSEKNPGIIIRELVNEYLSELSTRRYSPKSVQTYKKALDRFLSFLIDSSRERVQDVTEADLERYRLALVSRNFSENSQDIYLRAMRQFFTWLEETQRIFLNPAAHFHIPKPSRKLLPVPSEEEIARLLAQPNVNTPYGLRDRAVLETAYGTGARRQELCALEVTDVNLEGQLLRLLGKGSKERMVPLGQQAALWLGRYLSEGRPELLKGRDDKSALWIDRHGKALEYSALQQVIRCHVEAANITTPLSPHSLRRACATHMLRHGAHPMQLQLLLGHSSLRTLSQYLRLTITELKQTHARSNPGR